MIRHGSCAVAIHENRHGLGHADSVGQLDGALSGNAGCHQVLGKMPRSIGCRAVYLGGVLAGERSATVRCTSAVSVHDDLSTGQSRIAVRTTNHEPTRWVDVVGGSTGDQVLRDDGLNHVFDHILFDALLCDVLAMAVVLGMLRGDHDGWDTDDLAGIGVLHRYLGLGIRTEVGHQDGITLADIGKALHQLVGVVDRCRHELVGIAAGIAKHHTLVASATSVDAHGDIVGLAVDDVDHCTRFRIEAQGRIGVADVADHATYNLW